MNQSAHATRSSSKPQFQGSAAQVKPKLPKVAYLILLMPLMALFAFTYDTYLRQETIKLLWDFVTEVKLLGPFTPAMTQKLVAVLDGSFATGLFFGILVFNGFISLYVFHTIKKDIQATSKA